MEKEKTTQITIDENNINKRLDVFIVEYFKNQYQRSKITDFINKECVFVNSKKQKASYKLKNNDIVSFSNAALEDFFNADLVIKPYEYKLDIVYEDNDLIVINKPKQMLTHPTKYDRDKTLCNALVYHCKNNLSDISGSDRRGIVHRLDKNTAGLIVAAKNNDSHKSLAR